MGESACWLDRLCPDCAAVLDDAEDAAEQVRCPRCGAELSAAAVEQDDGDVDVS